MRTSKAKHASPADSHSLTLIGRPLVQPLCRREAARARPATRPCRSAGRTTRRTGPGRFWNSGARYPSAGSGWSARAIGPVPKKTTASAVATFVASGGTRSACDDLHWPNQVRSPGRRTKYGNDDTVFATHIRVPTRGTDAEGGPGGSSHSVDLYRGTGVAWARFPAQLPFKNVVCSHRACARSAGSSDAMGSTALPRGRYPASRRARPSLGCIWKTSCRSVDITALAPPAARTRQRSARRASASSPNEIRVSRLNNLQQCVHAASFARYFQTSKSAALAAPSRHLKISCTTTTAKGNKQAGASWRTQQACPNLGGWKYVFIRNIRNHASKSRVMVQLPGQVP